MRKQPIAVALVLATAATPAFAGPESYRRGQNKRPVETNVVTPSRRPAEQWEPSEPMEDAVLHAEGGSANHRFWHRKDHWQRRHDRYSWRDRHNWRWRDRNHHAWQRERWEEPDARRVTNPDTNSCVEGSVIGGLLGAGLGAALSRGDGRWIGVPLGGAAGALIGCQVDGG